MDVLLQTNDDAKYLALLNVERFADGSGFCVQLSVRSDAFAGSIQFCFEPSPLEHFVADLERMDRTLTGSARLKPLYEESKVTFEMLRTGGVAVSGDLVQYGGHTHRLQFGFNTDQTCLAPLIRDLHACLVAAAV